MARPSQRCHQNFGLIYGIYWHSPDFGKSVIAQGVDPLLAMFGVFLCRQPVNMHLLRDFLKRRDVLSGIEARVQPLFGHAPIFQGPCGIRS
jgi:hypothetical protein